MDRSGKNVFDSIIIVEDDKGLNRLIEKKLNIVGYNTISVFSGNEAIEIIEKNRNSLLLTDYILPDMEADELISTLKSRNIYLPFIVTTGRGDEKLAVEMMKNGALDYISKESGFLDLLPEIILQAENKVGTERRLESTEKALKESERNFRQIIKKSGNGMFVRQFGKFVLVNPSLVKSLEYSVDELLNENYDLMDVIHDNSKLKVKEF